MHMVRYWVGIYNRRQQFTVVLVSINLSMTKGTDNGAAKEKHSGETDEVRE